MTFITFGEVDPLGKFQRILNASDVFEQLFIFTSSNRSSEATQYLFENWESVREHIPAILTLAGNYHVDEIAKIIMLFCSIDKTMPSKEFAAIFANAEKETEGLIGCQHTASALRLFTPGEFGRIIDGYSVSRMALGTAASVLGAK